MNTDLQAFLDKYHTRVIRKYKGFIILWIIISVASTVTTMFVIHLTAWREWGITGINLLILGYLLYKRDKTFTKFDSLKDLLSRPDHSVKSIVIHKKTKTTDNNRTSTFYSMEVVIASSVGEESTFVLEHFYADETLLSEAQTCFTTVYPKANVKPLEG